MSSSCSPDGDEMLLREPVLVREGGVAYAAEPVGDPFVALAELMEVVEALCPEWPRRHSTLAKGQFLL